MNVLIKKVKQGVKVRILYDEMGSRGVKKTIFKELIDAGGEVEVFFPSILPLINPRLISVIIGKLLSLMDVLVILAALM